MATVKSVVAMSDRRKDGTYNVKIRITHKRKSRYIKTPFYITADQLTRTGKIKDAIINDKMEAEVRKYRSRINEIGFVCDSLDIDNLMPLLLSQDSSYDFFSYANDYMKKLNDNDRKGTGMVLRNALVRLRTYNGTPELKFSAMTERYIIGFHEHLTDAGYKPAYVKTTIAMIQSVYNDAKRKLNDESSGKMIVMWDCFSSIRKTSAKSDTIVRRAFESVDEMQRMIDVPYSDVYYENVAKDMFIFSFVCFGMNMSDILELKKSDVKDGILTFNRKKVRRMMGERSIMKIRLCDVANEIIEKYTEKGTDRLIYIRCRKGGTYNPARYIRNVFKRAGLYEGYVFYTARHSMATFARNVCGIDMFTVHEMLDHATPNQMKITDVYIHRDYQPLWNANEKVLNLFDWSFYL